MPRSTDEREEIGADQMPIPFKIKAPPISPDVAISRSVGDVTPSSPAVAISLGVLLIRE
jgi:hypothetical protein